MGIQPSGQTPPMRTYPLLWMGGRNGGEAGMSGGEGGGGAGAAPLVHTRAWPLTVASPTPAFEL